jgi:hypothetical protein
LEIQPVRLSGGWWLVLVCSERRVLLASCGWLLVADSFWEKSTAGWWLISRANRLVVLIGWLVLWTISWTHYALNWWVGNQQQWRRPLSWVGAPH